MLLKVFVFDVDTRLLGAVPWLEPLLRFRFLILLAAVASIGMFVWRLRALLAALYVLFFPWLLIFWKISAFAHRHRIDRNWAVWMVLFQGVIAGVRGARFVLVALPAALLSALVIILFDSPYLLVPAAAVLTLLLFWATYRVIASSLRSSAFLTSQLRALDSVATQGAQIWKIEIPTAAGTVLSRAELQQIATNIFISAMVNRSLYLWAYKLQQYRQSSLGLLLALFGYSLLYLAAVGTAGFVNLALLEIDGSQFTSPAPPSGLAMILYGLSSLFRNEGGGVSARGDAAYLIELVAGIYGPVLLGLFVFSAIFTLKTAREDRDLKETLSELSARAREQEDDSAQTLRMGLDEALERLRGLGLVGLLFIY